MCAFGIEAMDGTGRKWVEPAAKTSCPMRCKHSSIQTHAETLFFSSLSRIGMHQTDLTSTFAFPLVLVLPLLEVLGSAHQKCSGYT